MNSSFVMSLMLSIGIELKFENVVERCCIYLSSLRSERDIY